MFGVVGLLLLEEGERVWERKGEVGGLPPPPTTILPPNHHSTTISMVCSTKKYSFPPWTRKIYKFWDEYLGDFGEQEGLLKWNWREFLAWSFGGCIGNPLMPPLEVGVAPPVMPQPEFMGYTWVNSVWTEH